MGIYKRTTKNAKKAVKKRYGFNKASKGIKYGKMATDVAKLAMMINAEKKVFNQIFTNQNLGQVNGNSTGALCYDVTPLIPQGASQDERNGASVKLHTALYQFQFTQLASLTINQKIIIEFWKTMGTTLTTADLITKTFDNATFSTVIDTNSPRQQANFSDFQLIRRVIKTLPADQISQSTTITFDVPIKFNRGKGHHIRLVKTLSSSPTADITNGQIYMTVRAGVGNANAITTSTLAVPETATNTGSVMRFAYRTWYYDN